MVLADFGVSRSAEETYRALLANPRFDRSQLAAHLSRPLAEVDHDLAALEAFDLLSNEGGGLLALPPDLAVEKLIEREEILLLERRAKILASRDQIGELVATFVDGRRVVSDGDLLEQIDEPRGVRSRIFQLTSEATVGTLTMVPGEAFNEEATEAAERTDLRLLERGLSVRLLVSSSSLADQRWRRYLAAVVAHGGQVRVHPAPPMLLVVIDETAIIPISGSFGARLLHGADLAQPTRLLFEEIWLRSEPYAASRVTAQTAEVSDVKVRHVVQLLGQGLKDDTIARRMGVSGRTVRRLVAQAVADLGAHSRFQAGVRAAQLGWLAGDSNGEGATDMQ